MSKARLLGLLLITSARSVAAQDAALLEADVVRLSAARNPQVKAALLQLESADWDVRGYEAQYTPVLQLDASATQTKNPNLAARYNLSQIRPGSGTTGTTGGATGTTPTTANVTPVTVVTTNTIQRADAGAQISKHTLWGTDLTLRLSSFAIQTAYNQSFAGSPSGVFGPGYGMVAKLTLKQPLMRGKGRAVNEADLLASRVNRDTAQHTRDRVASEVLRDALTAYWELWYSGMAVDIELQALEVAKKQRDDAAARAQTGTLAPADVLAFETEVATQQENVLNAQLTFQQSQLDLLEKLGIIGEQSMDSVRAGSEPVASVPPRDEAVRRALAESAELKELMSALQLAALQQKTAGDPQRPRLDIDAYAQAQGLGNQDVAAAMNQFITGGAISAFVSLTYEAPVKSTQQRATVAKARLATEAAQEQLRQGRQRITSQVAQLHAQSQAGESSVQLAEQTMEIARKQLAAEQARYATGASTSVQVLAAEDAVRAAQLRVARARADFVQSVLGLRHLTGDLLGLYANAR